MTKPLTIEEMRANAADVHAELADQEAQDQHERQLQAPAYPQPEPEPARPTLAERWAEFWRNRRIAQLRARIQREQRLIDGMPAAIEQARAEADEEHQLRLLEISALADFHMAEARHKIFQSEVELQRLGAK